MKYLGHHIFITKSDKRIDYLEDEPEFLIFLCEEQGKEELKHLSNSMLRGLLFY